MLPPFCDDISTQSEPSPRREVNMPSVVATLGRFAFQLMTELQSLPTGSSASDGSGEAVTRKSSKEATPVPLAKRAKPPEAKAESVTESAQDVPSAVPSGHMRPISVVPTMRRRNRLNTPAENGEPAPLARVVSTPATSFSNFSVPLL